MEDHDDDVLGVREDRHKLDQEAPSVEGPPVSQLATTYGSSFIESEEQAERVASDTTDDGNSPPDGLGRPRPSSEATGQG